MEYDQYFIDKLLELPFDKKLIYLENIIYHDIFMHDKDWRVRDVIAKCGSDEHREILADDENEKVRMSATSDNTSLCKETRSFSSIDYRMDIAEGGPNKYRDLLVFDPVWQVRELIARYGTNKQRDTLVYDPNPRIRIEVATHGTGRHREILLKDPDLKVREAIVYYGSKKHVKKLTKDFDVSVEANMRFDCPQWWHKK